MQPEHFQGKEPHLRLLLDCGVGNQGCDRLLRKKGDQFSVLRKNLGLRDIWRFLRKLGVIQQLQGDNCKDNRKHHLGFWAGFFFFFLNWAYLFGDTYDRDYNILGSNLGPPIYGN